MLSADPERAERHDGLLTSGGRSRGGILALCWVTPTPARRQHAAVSHEQSAQIYVYISKSLHLGAVPLVGFYLVAPPSAEVSELGRAPAAAPSAITRARSMQEILARTTHFGLGQAK